MRHQNTLGVGMVIRRAGQGWIVKNSSRACGPARFHPPGKVKSECEVISHRESEIFRRAFKKLKNAFSNFRVDQKHQNSFSFPSLGRSLDRPIARSRSIARSLDRSLFRSLARSLARSLDRSLDRSLNRSLARSLDRSLARSLAPRQIGGVQ